MIARRGRRAGLFWGGLPRAARLGLVGLRAASRGRLEAARETRPGREASRVHLHAIAAAGADGEGLGRGLNRALLCYLLIHRPLLSWGARDVLDQMPRCGAPRSLVWAALPA